uniref:Uncharacterized protein n=1 Tax=Ditylenchus dipsaci TaxID=166011 RepID=A0A915D1D2_9BILA
MVGHFPISKHHQFPSAKLSEIPVVAPEAEFSFHANDTLMHVRTDSWMLSYNTCLEARFRLEGKRTRLLIYTCRMVEGGMCILDKFLADPYNPRSEGSIEKERFVRRPRKFSDKETEERQRRRRHGKRALREVVGLLSKASKSVTECVAKDLVAGRKRRISRNKWTMKINIAWWEERGLSKKRLKTLMKILRLHSDGCNLSLFRSHIREAVPIAKLILNWLIFLLHH